MDVDVLEHPLGMTWTVREGMQRSSHALVEGERVWLVDPVDHDPALERALELGRPAAVLQLLDRHGRDASTLARRLGVDHLRLPDAVPDGPFQVLRVVDVPGWRERALWWAQRRALVVAEAVGTPGYFTAGTGRLGVHPFLRLLPPGRLRRWQPEHLLTGHGPPLLHGAAGDLERALQRSRRDLPAALARLPQAAR